MNFALNDPRFKPLGGDNMVASLDLDFPSLGNRPTLQNSLPPNRNYGKWSFNLQLMIVAMLTCR